MTDGRYPAVNSPLEPTPVDGCKECESAAERREVARELGNALEVRSANQELSRHPHGEESSTLSELRKRVKADSARRREFGSLGRLL